MAVKDAKVDSEGGERTSPIKTTVLGKKLQPIASASSPVTPMKMMPKLVSPQMKGGLIKVAPSPRASTPSAGPRTLISPSVRPGLVRNSVATGPRPAIVSPRMPTVLGVYGFYCDLFKRNFFDGSICHLFCYLLARWSAWGH